MRKRDLNKFELTFIDVLSEIDHRAHDILILRFIASKSLKEVAKMYKITDQRVKDIEEESIEVIRKYFAYEPSSGRIQPRQE